MINELKIAKEVYEKNNFNNEPGRTSVWIKQSTGNGFSENNLDTRNIIDCILKGNNSTVEVLKNKMNTVTNLSSFVSVCCHISTKNNKKRKRKINSEDIMVQCFICFKCYKIHKKFLKILM